MWIWTYLGLAVGILDEAPMFGDRLLLVATNLAVGVAFAAAGAVVADEKGQRRNAVAFGVAAVLWPVNWAGGWSGGPGAVADVVIGPFSPLLVIWALARYPKPWARRRDERAVVALLLSVQLWTVPMVLTSRPGWSGFKPGSWWWTVWPSRTVFDVSLVVNGIVGTLAAVGLGGLVVYRIRRLTGPDRGQTMPIAWAVSLTAAAWAASEVGWTLTSSPSIRYAFAETEEATMLGMPIAFLVVVMRRRLAGEAVTRLGGATDPATGSRGASAASDRARLSTTTRLWENGALRLRMSTVAALRGIPDADRYAEEWEFDMGQLTAGWARFRWALSLRLRAPRTLRRAAHRRPDTASVD